MFALSEEAKVLHDNNCKRKESTADQVNDRSALASSLRFRALQFTSMSRRQQAMAICSDRVLAVATCP